MEIDLHPIKMIKAIKYKNQKRDPDIYAWSGLEVYMGAQGKGKTLSAVREIKKRLEIYPKAKFITNVKIQGIKNETTFFSTSDELVKILKKEINPNERIGYVIFIDEIHVVLAELFRKNRPNIFNIFITTKKAYDKYNRNFTNV